jgi:hypothetical protein
VKQQLDELCDRSLVCAPTRVSKLRERLRDAEKRARQQKRGSRTCRSACTAALQRSRSYGSSWKQRKQQGDRCDVLPMALFDGLCWMPVGSCCACWGVVLGGSALSVKPSVGCQYLCN